MSYQPPYQLTNSLLSLVADIAEMIGRWSAENNNTLVPHLRRENRIRTIQASLAVEQNTLTLEQVTALLNGKTVLGSPKEIQEVHNAFEAYEAMPNFKAHKLEDLIDAHKLLLTGLILDAGQWRSSGVGIYRGKELVHMAPPASQVPRLMEQLFTWLKTTNAHPLISSAAFHYELEFIHPFSDGNGRIGRFWQTKILSEWQPILAFLPVETVIKLHQNEYYQFLGEADALADCTKFIEFMLFSIRSSLSEAIAQQENTGQVAGQVAGQVIKLLNQLESSELSRKELMENLVLKGRDNFEKLYLLPALQANLVEMTLPDKPTSSLQKYRLTNAGKSYLDSQKRKTTPT